MPLGLFGRLLLNEVSNGAAPPPEFYLVTLPYLEAMCGLDGAAAFLRAFAALKVARNWGGPLDPGPDAGWSQQMPQGRTRNPLIDQAMRDFFSSLPVRMPE